MRQYSPDEVFDDKEERYRTKDDWGRKENWEDSYRDVRKLERKYAKS